MFMPPNPQRDQFESQWASIFNDYDLGRSILFKLTDELNQVTSLKIYFDQRNPITPSTQLALGSSVPTTIVPLAFERVLLGGKTNKLYATVNQQGHFHLDQGQDLRPNSEFFSSNWQSNATQMASWFSQISIDVNDQTKDIVNLICRQFPEIADLAVQAPTQFPLLYATLKYSNRKIPLSLVSSGINKFISLILAIRIFKGGVVLIDEMENGIYYQMFPIFWEALYQSAVETNTQLFLSTHSWECLKAAVPLIEKHSDDFSLIQVFQDQGITKATSVSGSDAAAAIDSDIEVRR
ncbi:putative AbiEii toxin of type IV toxin-antitoxin system [Halothiobacillus neapolitanus]|nr:putative AbiEii toxin of type IV toxin-antitoxin system [Halothiobacillus neapolitanus]